MAQSVRVALLEGRIVMVEERDGAVSRERVEAALQAAVAQLLARRRPEGYWEGHLSSSALSTATAVSALCVSAQEEDRPLVQAGAGWLCAHQNDDGGWGDTTDSPSNLATTLLAVSALTLAGEGAGREAALARAEGYVSARGAATPAGRVAAVRDLYGEDRTFAVPILMNCALAGLVPWREIPGLPFELAALPHSWFKALRLHVVSYALPALIGIGMLLHRRQPPANPLARLARRLATRRALARLERIQPENGGFLEATPLTSFVCMALAPLRGNTEPPGPRSQTGANSRGGDGGPIERVVGRCLEFLRASMRPDGSWPIDTNLAVWLTTGSLAALARAGALEQASTPALRRWLLAGQYREAHPYTNAAPGAWSWTQLPGAVPDADDTAGAMVALARSGEKEALRAGAQWLLDLQNRDGGWPTFCQGWGQLPFDRSSPDITAHALRALRAALDAGALPEARCGLRAQRSRILPAMERGRRYLAGAQREDGSWVPLWFGNQYAPEQANPVLGTARVLLALVELDGAGAVRNQPGARGVQYLIAAQARDGGWGGAAGVAPTVEETALAVSALSAAPQAGDACSRGVAWLVRRVEQGDWTRPAPIGLYFSSLWYSEELYPVIWTVDALGRSMGGNE